jgi:hypothetical protein
LDRTETNAAMIRSGIVRLAFAVERMANIPPPPPGEA